MTGWACLHDLENTCDFGWSGDGEANIGESLNIITSGPV